MATTNGKVKEDVARRAVEQASMPEKPWLHPDALRPRDHLRAKEALVDVLNGRSPYEMLGSGDEMYPYLMWCIKSRTDPTFTWEQALDTEFHEFRMGDDRPPPIPPLNANGRSDASHSDDGLKVTQPKPEPEPSSASSSD